MKKAVIYARFSSAKQNEQSIDGQIDACIKYAKENDFIIINSYVDRAISGRSDRRFEFQKMMDDAHDKKFDFILVYQYDRFSRNRRDSINYKYELKQLNIKLISVTEPMIDAPEKIFLESFLENIAEYYVLDLSRKVKRGMAETLKKRNSLGGTQPLGFKVVNKKIVIDENAVDAVKYIFNSVANGIPRSTIVEELNKRGIKNSRGNAFTENSLQHMLKNRKYIGEYESFEEVIFDYYPQIIDKKLFERVQKRLKHNKRVGGGMKRNNEKYLLSGKAQCGLCGSSLVGVSTIKNKTKKYTYYACSSAYKNHTCKKKPTSKKQLEEMVVDVALNYILDPLRFNYIIENMYKQIRKQHEVGNTELNILNKRKQTIEKEIQTVYKKFKNTSSPIILELLNKEADELGSVLKVLETDIAKEILKTKKLPTKEELSGWLLSHAVGDIKSDRFKLRTIEHLINQVFLFNDKIVIYFNIQHSRTISLAEVQSDLADGKLASIELECSYANDNGDPYGIRTHECMRERHVS